MKYCINVIIIIIITTTFIIKIISVPILITDYSVKRRKKKLRDIEDSMR